MRLCNDTLTFDSVNAIPKVDHHGKATEKHFQLVMFSMLFKVARESLSLSLWI